MSILSALTGVLGGSNNSLYNQGIGWLNAWGSAAMNSHYARELMDKQYNLERQSRQTYYGDAKKSLLDAGYNPLMAILGGSSAQSLSVGTPTPDYAGEGQNAYSNMVANATQKDLAKITKDKANAEIDNLNQKTETEKTIQQLNIAERGYRLAQTIGENKRNSWIENQIASELKNQAADTLLKLNGASAASLNAQTNRMNAVTSRLVGDANAYKMYNEAETQKTQQLVNKSVEKYNNERSRGYTTKVDLPLNLGSWSHTGNSLNPYNKEGHWETEYTKDGKPYKVYVLD